MSRPRLRRGPLVFKKRSGAAERGSHVFTHRMEASRTDVEGCAPLRHARKGCNVTLLVALQSVLLTCCLLAALYVYCTSKDPVPPMNTENADVFIMFDPINAISENTTLKFDTIFRKHRMNLLDNHTISTECTGPYILHMYVCYSSSKGEAHGSLQLQVAKTKDPLCVFELKTKHMVCRGLQSNTYLTKGEDTELHLSIINNFNLENVTVGFNYLLGSKCVY